MRWSQITEVGLVRKQNEDSICVIPDLAFFAVADGMGGHLAGEIASKMAIESITHQLKSGNMKEIDKLLLEGVYLANAKIFSTARKETSYRGMGTTITAAVISKRQLILAHVGDSRAYIIRDRKIHLLTEDHSLAQEMVRNGGITKEQARAHPHRNVLTRALGTDLSVDVDLFKFNLENRDIVLLCSDGLSGLLEDSEILGLVSVNDPARAAQNLVDEALNRGGTDNISVIVVVVDE